MRPLRRTPVIITFGTLSRASIVSGAVSNGSPVRIAASVRFGVITSASAVSRRIASTYSSEKQGYSRPLSPRTGSTITTVSSPPKSWISFSVRLICSTEPKKPVYMQSNFTPILLQCAAKARISSVISRAAKPSKPPVCVESMTVGSATASTPQAETIGSATEREHLPMQDKSFISIARGIPVSFIVVIAFSSYYSIWSPVRRPD